MVTEPLDPPPAVLPLSAVLGRLAFILPKRMSEWVGLNAHALRLLYLAHQREGVSQSEIERLFDLDGAAVTRLAKHLEAEGLIRRVPDPADNRYTMVFLTEAGRTRLAQVREAMRALETRLYEGIDPDDLARCRDVLERIRANLAALPARP
ncbi:MAG: MarR family transcriptional regulator [Chloroflexota bacterium]|nr:MarR family transcriptional regulator [Dehalococcoidia bacterium]MDW8252947.1 MarR family transcriptional regulator [Chloroflexota bacterium]